MNPQLLLSRVAKSLDSTDGRLKTNNTFLDNPNPGIPSNTQKFFKLKITLSKNK
jgi:hypothetical protein